MRLTPSSFRQNGPRRPLFLGVLRKGYTTPYAADAGDPVRLVGQVAAVLSIGAGVIHISAAGDHTNLPVMFAGFFHGAAMVGAAGVPAKEFAARAAAWLQNVVYVINEYAEIIDGGDYSAPGQQSLEFSDISDIIEASRALGISTEVVDVVQRLIHRQIDAGHGRDGFARVIESIKHPEAAA